MACPLNQHYLWVAHMDHIRMQILKDILIKLAKL